MIRCILELVPGGIGEPEHLGTIEISNQVARSMVNPRRGDYVYRLFKKRSDKNWHGRVQDFPRLSYHPWNLVREILNEVAKSNGGKI